MTNGPFREALTEYEREMLERLDESLHEIGIHASKLRRYGKDTCPADKASIVRLNGAALGLELGKLIAIIALLRESAVVDANHLIKGMNRGGDQLARYLQSEIPS